MSKRGPKPTPTATRKLRGSTLVTKRREAAEVKGPAGTPERPEWLDDEARLAWDQVVEHLYCVAGGAVLGVLFVVGRAATR